MAGPSSPKGIIPVRVGTLPPISWARLAQLIWAARQIKKSSFEDFRLKSVGEKFFPIYFKRFFEVVFDVSGA